MPNTCCRTLALAVLAGTTLGAASLVEAQSAVQPAAIAGTVRSITPSYITYRGVRYPVMTGGADDQSLIYQNSTGPLYYLANAGVSPYQLMDDVSYSPGPGAGAGRLVNALKIGFVTTGASTVNLDVEFTLWDTEFAGIPANQNQVGAPVVLTYPAPSGGWPAAVAAWTSDVSLTNLPGGGIPASADDQVLARYRMLQSGTQTPHAQGTPLFAMGALPPGAPPTVGNSRATFYYDANNDNQFANTEQYILTGFTTASNLYLEMQADVPPLFTGACCAADGTCSVVSPNSCATSGGLYRGNNVACAAANCNATGACCQLDGTCAVVRQAACKSTNGLYRGDNAACGSAANCPTSYAYPGGPVFITDAVGTTCGPQVFAELTVSDSFAIAGADASMFITHTWQGDLQVWLKHVQTGTTVRVVNQPSNGGGGFGADNFGGSPAAGNLFRTIDSAADFYRSPPVGSNGTDNVHGQWKPEAALSAFNGENSAGQWQLLAQDCGAGDFGNIEYWVLSLQRPGAGTCYANCDASTTPPVANVADFTCFLQKFAALDSYANCDGSTTPPVINVADFTCFLQKFAAGCP